MVKEIFQNRLLMVHPAYRWVGGRATKSFYLPFIPPYKGGKSRWLPFVREYSLNPSLCKGGRGRVERSESPSPNPCLPAPACRPPAGRAGTGGGTASHQGRGGEREERGGTDAKSERTFFTKFSVLLFLTAVLIVMFQPPTVFAQESSQLLSGVPQAQEKEPGLLDHIRDRLSVNGYLKNETSFRYKRPQGFDKVLNLFRLESRYSFSPKVKLTGILRTYYDAVYDIEDVDTVSPRIGPTTILADNPTPDQVPMLEVENVRDVEIERTDFDIRELFLDLRDFPIRNIDLRLGRQIVRWGVAEGARVTDIINPLDFKEFILREVNDRYVPLWMARMDYYVGDSSLQALWIPELTFHQPAPRSSEWEQFQFLPGLEKPESDYTVLGTDFAFENSEAAFKFTHPIGSWEISLSYFYTWDDFPTAFRNPTDVTPPALGQNVTRPTDFEQRYTRNHVIGGTFSKSFGPVVLGGEVAYIHNKHFGAGFVPFFGSPIVGGGVPTFPDTLVVLGGTAEGDRGVVQRDFLKYALQTDFSVFGADMSLQFLQQYIPEHSDVIIQDKFDTVASLFVRRVFANNLMAAQLLTIYFFNDREALIRPRMEYNVDDHLQIAFGADLLEGEITHSKDPFIPGDFTFVGFFKNNSRFFIEFKYSF